ncbi:hypothetical protein HK102_006392, partial [Quaeritorhiza haematococci]
MSNRKLFNTLVALCVLLLCSSLLVQAAPIPNNGENKSAEKTEVSKPKKSGHTVPFDQFSCDKHYVVKDKDICFNIAAENGLTVDDLRATNPGLNCNLLLIGQKLCVKVKDYLKNCAKKHTVKKGDICFDIAKKHGLSVNQLADLNPGLNCNLLLPEQPLCLEKGAAKDAAPKDSGNNPPAVPPVEPSVKAPTTTSEAPKEE